jgi:hypothetical protein
MAISWVCASIWHAHHTTGSQVRGQAGTVVTTVRTKMLQMHLGPRTGCTASATQCMAYAPVQQWHETLMSCTDRQMCSAWFVNMLSSIMHAQALPIKTQHADDYTEIRMHPAVATLS